MIEHARTVVFVEKLSMVYSNTNNGGGDGIANIRNVDRLVYRKPPGKEDMPDPHFIMK